MSRFLKVIVNIILVCAILTAAALLVPPLVGVQTFVMDDMSMQTNLAAGSVTYAVPKEAQEMKNGDKVLEEASTGNYVYRITNLNVEENTCTLTAPGTSPQVTKEANISNGVSKVVFTMPFIGYVVMAMRSMEGLIIIGLAVVFVILLFILSEICKKDDDDDDDEEEMEEEDPIRRRAAKALPQEEEEEDDDDEDEGLSRKERKRRKKEAKAADKAARKEAKSKKKRSKYEDDDEEEEVSFPEEEEQQVEPMAMPVAGTEQELSVEEQLASVVRQFEREQAELAGQQSAETPEAGQPVQKEGVSAEEMQTPGDDSREELKVPPVFHQEEPSNEPVIPNYTVQELMKKAQAAGAKAEVVEDKDAGVTLVDYSDWLRKK
ncbi:MAG TPA: hypothetical protein IAB98_05665 [Candidatus Egerieimonas intestinavium]|uniref:Uncharacterized protein n=1 Tax=Candidatus Egerieimonas intestinavium TaxID=2840777 RepID=A0A9D1EJD9_9FIRM|nr:hypothetical protein [Candidatus Egerieimonas intestinavium]